eukprot:COSAG01_NODE_36493_length_517_cov_0.610048_2_plen_32_part_01
MARINWEYLPRFLALLVAAGVLHLAIMRLSAS